MSEYRSDEYSDFEASAFAQLSCSVYEDDDDELEHAPECSPLEECDQAFEELYSSATFTEDDMPLPEKGSKKKIRLWRSSSNRSEDCSSSVASDRSRISCQSGLTSSSTTLSAPGRGVDRTQSRNNTTTRKVNRAFSSPGTSLRRTMPSGGAPLRGKSCDDLHEMVQNRATSLSKSLPRRVFRMSSSNTKMSYPEDRSINETQSAAARIGRDDSDSTVYFDNSQRSTGESSEASMDHAHGTKGPPVFLVETALQCAHESLNSSALMYGSIQSLSFEREGEIEI